MRVLFLCLLSGGFVLAANAQTDTAKVRAISLQECVDSALTNNLDIQIIRRTPDIARFNLAAAQGTFFDPVFSFEAKQEFWDVPPNFNNAKVNDDNPYEQMLNTYSVGLNGRLTPGLSYDFAASSTHDSVFSDFSATSSPSRQTNNYEAVATLTLRQALLKDLWTDSGRMLIQVNKRNLKVSEQELRLQIMRTVLAVQVAYFDLVYAIEHESLAQKNFAVAEEAFKAQAKFVEVKQLPALSEKLSESQMETARVELLTAQDNVEAKRSALRVLVVSDVMNGEDEVLEPFGLPSSPAESVDRNESLKKAMTLRPDLALAKLEVEKQGIVLRYSHNQLFPTLDLVGTYGGLAVEHESRAESFNTIGNFEHPVYGVGIVFKIPLSNAGARNNYKASQQLKEQAVLRLKKVEQDIFIQVDDAISSLQNTFQRLTVARRAREAAEGALQGEQERLAVQQSTPLAVSEAERRVASTHTAEVLATIEYHKAVALLAFNEGTSLERNHIVLDLK